MKRLAILLSVAFALSSCEKEEIALPAVVNDQNTAIDTSSGQLLIPKGATFLSQVFMESDYRNQIWFDLGTNSVVSSNLRTDWDLAFDCKLNENILYLNSALNASVAFTNESDFSKVSSDAGLEYVFEHQSGKKDSLAVGDVSQLSEVIIIDRGYDPLGNPLGKWKLQLTEVKNGSYSFQCARLNGNQYSTATISKSPQYNRVAYSFSSQSQLQIEPPKVDYDLCFSQYTFVFTNPPLAYSVNGVIINSHKTEVAEEFQMDFDDIDNYHAESLFYSDNKDVIGYDWKDFSLQTNTYTIFSNQVYLIRDAAGEIYKLRFLDFYDDDGVKGAPSFELMRL